jgi:hypothetical protein
MIANEEIKVGYEIGKNVGVPAINNHLDIEIWLAEEEKKDSEGKFKVAAVVVSPKR